MAKAGANGIEITYELFGELDGEPLLLIHGLGTQYTDWAPLLIERWAAQGYLVIAFDNRDQGESTWFDELGLPDFDAVFAGDASKAPYLLSDMAADARALLEVLDIESAHVLGVSMGGMIAQQFAIDFPDATRTLTSIMSSPDMRNVGHATPEATAALLAPPAQDRAGALDQAVATARVIGSPGFPFDEDLVRTLAGVHWDRGNHPDGTTRQTAAIFSSPDRRPALHDLRVASLVVHGADDPLITLPGGEATAEALQGSELWVVPGMGHSIPVELWDELIARHQDLVASNR
jgi:pimeloyl-ACP methyl ester carboxylesterase